MKVAVDKSKQEHQSRANANQVAQQQTRQGVSLAPPEIRSFAFEETRPEAFAQRMERIFGRPVQARMEGKGVFQMKPDAASIQRQAMPEEEKPLPEKFEPLQRQENKTGLPDKLKTGIENLSGYTMGDATVRDNSPKPIQLQANPQPTVGNPTSIQPVVQSTQQTAIIQRTIGGYIPWERWRKNELREQMNKLREIGEQLGWTLSEQEIDLVDQLAADTTPPPYSLDDVVNILKQKAQPVATSGPVTVLSQNTVDPAVAEKSSDNYETRVVTKFKGEKARISIEALVQLNDAADGTLVGYLQTVRFSRRVLHVGGLLYAKFNLANTRDGSEAPWMRGPVPAVDRPVVIKMEDEPASWMPAADDAPDVSAQGIDIFTTWLVSTITDTPGSANDVEFLYHWNWTIDWTKKSCKITSAGSGQGQHIPNFGGESVNSLYNNYLQELQSGTGNVQQPSEKYNIALQQLREGLKGPNLDTTVDKETLKEILGELRTEWNRMDIGQREDFKSKTIVTLDQFVMRVYRYRPAQSLLGEIFKFDGL